MVVGVAASTQTEGKATELQNDQKNTTSKLKKFHRAKQEKKVNREQKKVQEANPKKVTPIKSGEKSYNNQIDKKSHTEQIRISTFTSIKNS